jgi:hypothetical protein
MNSKERKQNIDKCISGIHNATKASSERRQDTESETRSRESAPSVIREVLNYPEVHILTELFK